MNLTGFRLINGTELLDRTAYFTSLLPGAGPDTEDHTAFLVCPPDRQMAAGTVIKRVTMDVAPAPDSGRVGSIDETGVYFDYLRDDGRKSLIRNPEEHVGNALIFLENIHGRYLCGGAGHHVYERAAEGVWHDISADQMRVGEEPLGLTCVTGPAADELYFAGWRGALWSLSSGNWMQIDSPTNLLLNCATTVSDRCLVAGQVGTILEGRGNDWRAVEQDITEDDFRSCATFDGNAYFATDDAIYRLSDGALDLFALAGEDFLSTKQIFTGPSGLWSVGTFDISLFDDNGWTRIAKVD